MTHKTEGYFPTTFRFTKTKLQEAVAMVVASGKRQVEFCDTELPNFRLIAYSSGKATFTTRYRLRKRRDSIGHGDFRLLHLEDARNLHRQVMLDVAQGKDPKASRKAKATFAECVPEFLKLGAGKKRDHAGDVSKFEKRLTPKFGHLPLDAISTAMLNDYLNSLHTKEQLEPATVNRYGSALRTFFRWACRAGHLPSGRSPMELVQPFPEDNVPTDCMSIADLALFIDAAMGEKDYQAGGLLALLGLTGARLSEWLDADWWQIDWTKGFLKLPAAKSKNKHDDSIPLSDEALAILEVIAEANGTREGKIFPGRRGNVVMSRPGKAFDRVCEKVGLTGRGFTIHSLRHAVASALLNSGRDRQAVRWLLRHRSEGTLDRYGHAYAKTMKGTVRKLSRMVLPDGI
jgi:site-specific recombinase XerD